MSTIHLTPKQRVLQNYPNAVCRNRATNGTGSWNVQSLDATDLRVGYHDTPQAAWKAAAALAAERAAEKGAR